MLINKKEYHILKNLDEKWKWIARDEKGELYIHEGKPKKTAVEWVNERDYYIYLGNETFQFIQWEDEKPYNIQELINEYESVYHIKNAKIVIVDADKITGSVHQFNGSEEKEVKKDLNWLREQIKNEMNGWSGGNPDYFRGAEDAYEDVKDWLNQLDEPEITLDKAFEKVAESYSMTKEEIWRHLERFEAHGGKVTYGELDEPEVLSYEWIIENQERKGVHFFVNVTKLQNLLVPKQELPVIPKFVAEWIEENHERNMMIELSHLNDSLSSQNMKKEHKLYFWIKENFDAFAEAWIAYPNVEVEEEQKYYVINNDHRMMLVRLMDGNTITEADPFKLEDMHEVEKKSHRLTEQEIKDYDERYVPFMIPVEEVDNE